MEVSGQLHDTAALPPEKDKSHSIPNYLVLPFLLSFYLRGIYFFLLSLFLSFFFVFFTFDDALRTIQTIYCRKIRWLWITNVKFYWSDWGAPALGLRHGQVSFLDICSSLFWSPYISPSIGPCCRIFSLRFSAGFVGITLQHDLNLSRGFLTISLWT